jgi:hypothetical protein
MQIETQGNCYFFSPSLFFVIHDASHEIGNEMLTCGKIYLCIWMPPIKWYEHFAINPYRLGALNVHRESVWVVEHGKSCHYLKIFICHFTQKLDVKLLLQSSFLRLLFACALSLCVCHKHKHYREAAGRHTAISWGSGSERWKWKWPLTKKSCITFKRERSRDGLFFMESKWTF